MGNHFFPMLFVFFVSLRKRKSMENPFSGFRHCDFLPEPWKGNRFFQSCALGIFEISDANYGRETFSCMHACSQYDAVSVCHFSQDRGRETNSYQIFASSSNFDFWDDILVARNHGKETLFSALSLRLPLRFPTRVWARNRSFWRLPLRFSTRVWAIQVALFGPHFLAIKFCPFGFPLGLSCRSTFSMYRSTFSARANCGRETRFRSTF